MCLKPRAASAFGQLEPSLAVLEVSSAIMVIQAMKAFEVWHDFAAAAAEAALVLRTWQYLKEGRSSRPETWGPRHEAWRSSCEGYQTEESIGCNAFRVMDGPRHLDSTALPAGH